jgi:cation diffusion facilitator family transporter
MLESCSIEKRDTGVFLVNERKTKWVTIITLLTMIVEVIVGYWSGSMALLADGWHMASHTLALGLSLVVYYLYRHPRFKSSFTFGGGKILSLGGYTSALMLILIAISMIVESVSRFYEARTIHYQEAIWIASIGLVVNLVCAFIMHKDESEVHDHHSHDCDHEHHSHEKSNRLAPLKQAPSHGHHHHHHHHHHDHNHESAYIHILTDALTSVFAIVALILGQWQGWSWLDPFVGVLGGLVVFKWSLGLIAQSGMELLDAHDGSIDREKLIHKIEGDGSKVLDIHLWKVAPGQIGCELIIRKNLDQTSSSYRRAIGQDFMIHHLIIEVV